ncbi:MAG: TolC family outer membrane protein [Gammaproteobacteria bacterium]|nr:TolC family outer membrane protein [Gammaproteobacteria bacterium]NND59770.1 TolC family outer membrane protein [Gammaproteobacteria bacterium]
MKSATCLVLMAIYLFPGAYAADLLDVYDSALNSDPQLREADALRLASLETRPQARAGLLPQVALFATETDQGQDGLSSQFGQDGFIDTLIDSDTDQTFYGLSVTQPLFRWDQWLSLKQADKVVAQADVDYAVVKQELIVRVAVGYFDVLAARDDVEAAAANKEAIARQLEQAETRFEVGLIAITDVEESRAAYDQAIATEIQAKRLLATARENLRELTGSYVESLEGLEAGLALSAPVPADDEAWVNTAMENNLSLLSTRLDVEIAKDTINVERAGHFPTLDLVVRRNEFDSKSDQQLRFPPAPGAIDSPTRSDFSTGAVELQFNLPIYSGGSTSSRVRESVYRHRAARERLERVARETEREIRDAYLGVLSDVATIRALEQALSSSETALRATEAGFDVGTRTSVDVLNARRNLLNARTNLARSRYDYVINMLRLKRAAGTLSLDDLREVNGWLD